MHDTQRPHRPSPPGEAVDPQAEQLNENKPAEEGISSVYERSADGSLREGEILSNVVQAHLDVASLRGAELTMNLRMHPYAVVLTQDCDLIQDYELRQTGGAVEKLLPNVLLCEVNSEDELHRSVQKSGLGSKDWRALRQNKLERYQFLEGVSSEGDATRRGLPSLGIDFKRYFTVPVDELYFRVGSGETVRRCRLVGPYIQHLRTRFFNYQSRVALPRDHRTD